MTTIKDLSDIEDSNDRAFFIQIGKDAATNAINENIAMRIPITFLQDGWVVRKMPNGNIEKIHQLKDSSTFRKQKLTVGTVLRIEKGIH